jgi:AAA15 family ATPase/GTPase
MLPKMNIVAGPPGSGKSTLFPADRAAHDNSDHNSRPRLMIFLAERVPSWIQQALQGTEFDPTERRK